MEVRQDVVVFILGFHGSFERYFEPLKQFYETLAAHVVVHVPEMYQADFLPKPSASAEPFARSIYQPALARVPNARVLFHVFSMNGTTLFWLLWQTLNRSERDRIRGIVFDSAPGRISSSLTRHLGFTFGSRPKDQQTSWDYWIHHLPKQLPNSIMYVLKTHLDLVRQIALEMADEKSALPPQQLYLCATDDTAMVTSRVREFAVDQLLRGRAVEFKEWPHGLHCTYFREPDKADEYRTLCRRFFQRAFVDHQHPNTPNAKL